MNALRLGASNKRRDAPRVVATSTIEIPNSQFAVADLILE